MNPAGLILEKGTESNPSWRAVAETSLSKTNPDDRCNDSKTENSGATANLKSIGPVDFLDVSETLQALPANDCPTLSQHAAAVPPASGQETCRVLHEVLYSTEGVCAVAAQFCLPPATMLDVINRGDGAGSPQSPLSPVIRTFLSSDPGTHWSCRTSKENIDFDRFDTRVPTPRAPRKPARVRKLESLVPSRTRRRLFFDN